MSWIILYAARVPAPGCCSLILSYFVMSLLLTEFCESIVEINEGANTYGGRLLVELAIMFHFIVPCY